MAIFRFGEGIDIDPRQFLQTHVEPGSTIGSDGLNDYPPVLAALGYKHDRRVQGNPAKTGQVVPFAHRAISNMKAWLVGTHHGVGRPHLQAYLDEFARSHFMTGRLEPCEAAQERG